MIACKGRLSYVKYLPVKPIKRGIKAWMCIEGDTAYLYQFEVYLGWEKNSEFGLEYYVVMKLCKEISGQNHHI